MKKWYVYALLPSDDVLVLLDFASLAGVWYVFVSLCITWECTAGHPCTDFF
jgi:hypothetical protein